MTVTTQEILDILDAKGLSPEGIRENWGEEVNPTPDVGSIREEEGLYTTSLDDVFREPKDGDDGRYEALYPDDSRLDGWLDNLDRIMSGNQASVPHAELSEPPEPICAWYQPLHFFRHAWGIYIREECVAHQALAIANYVDWSRVALPRSEIMQQLLRASFYLFFLHEQFHHKVESLGFRLLMASGTDKYVTYKFGAYQPFFMTSLCLEESLANADSYLRLSEDRYVKKLKAAFHDALRAYLRASMAMQPPGYKEGLNYLSPPAFRSGLHKLKTFVLEGTIFTTTPSDHWAIAPNMIKSLKDIGKEIYVILPRGARPIFPSTLIDPGVVIKTRDAIAALRKHYGYTEVGGAKHIKLTKPGAPVIELQRSQTIVVPHIAMQILEAVTGARQPLQRFRDLLEGRLTAAH